MYNDEKKNARIKYAKLLFFIIKYGIIYAIIPSCSLSSMLVRYNWTGVRAAG